VPPIGGCVPIDPEKMSWIAPFTSRESRGVVTWGVSAVRDRVTDLYESRRASCARQLRVKGWMVGGQSES
jgi:hypothetical protein